MNKNFGRTLIITAGLVLLPLEVVNKKEPEENNTLMPRIQHYDVSTLPKYREVSIFNGGER